MDGRRQTTDSQNRFTIYPAIDLRAGKVVRLVQGDLARTTVYGDDPMAMAERWKSEGAEWLHVVNLDGAFGESARANWESLAAILRVGIKTQFGGGLREMDSIGAAMALGVARVIIGTAAVERPALVDEALREFGPELIAVGVDAKDGMVRVRGWAEESGMTAMRLGQRLSAQGVRTIIFTDVARDGIGLGVNVERTVELAEGSGLEVIASGGVAGLEDVKRVRGAGLSGLIIGRALYEGRVDLREALRLSSEPQSA